MRTLYSNILASPTGTLPLGGYALSNLLTSRLSRRARFDDGSMVSVEFDLGSAIEFNTFCIISHNISSGATIQLKTGTSVGFSTATDTFTIMHAEKNIWQEVTQSVATRYVRLEVTDTSNPDGYVDIGRLMAGTRYLMPGIGPTISRAPTERGSAARSGTDQVYGERRYRRQSLSVQFPGILQNEIAAYETYLGAVGISVPHVIYIDEIDTLSITLGVKVLHIVLDEATQDIDFNAAREFTTTHDYTEAF